MRTCEGARVPLPRQGARIHHATRPSSRSHESRTHGRLTLTHRGGDAGMGSGYARAGCWGARNTRAGAEATHKTAETQGEKREAQQKKGGRGGGDPDDAGADRASLLVTPARQARRAGAARVQPNRPPPRVRRARASARPSCASPAPPSPPRPKGRVSTYHHFPPPRECVRAHAMHAVHAVCGKA